MLKRNIVVCSTILFFYLHTKAEALPKPPPEDKEIPKVFANTIKAQELFDIYNYPARVIPKVNATVLADIDGVVTKIITPLGSKVKVGARLLQIKHTDPIYQYAAAYVLAPVTGVVSSLSVREGTQVAKNQELVTVMDPEKVRIEVEIAAIDLPAIKAGTPGEFHVNGREASLPVAVAGVSPFVRPETGTATCELLLSDSKKAIVTPGLVGQVTFKANVRKGFIVPDSSIYYKEGETYLRVVENDGIARKVPVMLGRKQKGMVEIIKGIAEGQVVIERSSRFVGDGQKVEVQQTEKKAG